LTFSRSHSIYESRCDFLNRKFDSGESFNEERNQESTCEEKGSCEEKEVAFGVPDGTLSSKQQHKASATRPFLFGVKFRLC
jgi:hypothetical protein